MSDNSTYPNYKINKINSTGLEIKPNKLILVNTHERIKLSREYAGFIQNLSGLARLGLQIMLSNFINPGFGEISPSTLTLEILNYSGVPIRIYPTMRICHLIFFNLSSKASSGYDTQVGTYAEQTSPMGSMFHTDFQKAKNGGKVN